MTIISHKIIKTVCAEYNRVFHLNPAFVGITGEIVPNGNKKHPLAGLPSFTQTNAFSLQEAVRWGEPFVFYPSKGIISWIVALVNQRNVMGGLLGGEVLTVGSYWEETSAHLIEQGMTPEEANNFSANMPAWSPSRIREAAMFLQDVFYRASGWKPALLEENKIKALQQRHISEAMEEQKKSGDYGYSRDKERALLSLIRAGDHNGARRMLNDMLGNMYLLSSKLAVLRARSIELMGYLARTAVEDNPVFEPLIERNHAWMHKLIEAPDFETLSQVLMRALDDFMQGIYARGFNCYHPRVGRLLDYLALHYSEQLSLKQIADNSGMSVSRIAHLVKQHTGKTIWQHMMRIRIAKARQLLEKTEEPCSQIAFMTGFCDQSYFTKHFRRLTGATPANYRRSLAGSVSK